MNKFVKFLKKTFTKTRIPTDGFKKSDESITEKFDWYAKTKKREKYAKSINVNTDVAFHKPISKVIETLKEKIDNVDYTDLSFDEEITDFNLSRLSPEATKIIIEIIKEDLQKNRLPFVKTYNEQ